MNKPIWVVAYNGKKYQAAERSKRWRVPMVKYIPAPKKGKR